MMWCSFCCAVGEQVPASEVKAHLDNLGAGCPHRTGPCPDCTNGDHDCVNAAMTRVGCEACRWTGYCPTCKGSGDKNPTAAQRREYQNEAKRAARRRAREARPIVVIV